MTSFCPHQHPSFPVYDFTLLPGMAFLDDVRLLSIISARLELMRSPPAFHRRHTVAVGGSTRLDLMQAPHIIHSSRCVHFFLVNCMDFVPAVPSFLHVVETFFLVLQVESLRCPPFSHFLRHFCTSWFCSQLRSAHSTS